MAAVGLRFFVAAQIDDETRGQAITYRKGMRLGPARAANVTFERNTDPLYGDDVIQDDDNGITGGNIETESTQMTSAERTYVLSEEPVEGANGEYDGSDAPSPYVGTGYFRVLRQNRDTIYEAWWFHKVQFSENNINGVTKEGKIVWQTPKINGRMMGVFIDDSGRIRFYRRKECASEAAAILWLVQKSRLASDYSSTATYSKGEYAIYDSKVYEAIAAISTAEQWTAAHWREVVSA